MSDALDDVVPQLAWLRALRDPAVTLRWSLGEWESVVRLARRLRLLARLGAGLHAVGLIDTVPEQPRRHLLAEERVSRWRTQALLWSLDRIGAALGSEPYPKVLLKGAAYVGQDLPIALGRLPSDVDILVPHAHLAAAQALLARAGWQEIALDEHDQHYYREWSHESPPLRNAQHRIELDLHHNILPPVARTRVDSDRLLERLQPSRWPSWSVFHPVDQVLHSAAHLFLDSEVRDRVRDLVDLDGLFRWFGARAGFWDELPERAGALGLAEPLALACYFCIRWLGTPIPEDTVARIAQLGPSALRRAWLLPLLRNLLTPTAPDLSPSWKQDLAATIFLARYHRNRMPMRLLVPHLWHKLHPKVRSVDLVPVTRHEVETI